MKTLIYLALFCVFAASQAKIVPVQGSSQYSLTYWQAFQKCHDVGASLASPQDLEDARAKGYSHCACGWLNDKTARFPMAVSRKECGGSAAVHTCDWQNTWNAFCYMGGPVGNCSKALGMESGAIHNLQITSSSTYHTFWNERWDPSRARLHKAGVVNGWMPHHDGRNQYIEVNLEQPMAITGIITQGLKRYLRHQYVTSFKVAYSKDGDFWRYYTDDRTPKVFRGNVDNNGLVRNTFYHPIVAQYFRLYPYTWEHHISIRFELLGCEMEDYDEALERQREISVISTNT